jgi:Dna[CI] antecedent, DciA
VEFPKFFRAVKILVKPPFSRNSRHLTESNKNINFKTVSHLPCETAILELRGSENQPATNQVLSSLQRLSMEQAGLGIEKIVAASLRRAPAGTGPLLAWPIACGQTVAARTSALEFDDGILRVQVPDAGWRAELRSLAPQYLAVVNRYTGNRVRRIEFVLPEVRR